MSSAPVLRLDLEPSRRLAGVLVIAHGVALAVAWTGLGGWVLYSLAAAILASLAACLVRVRRCPLSLELHEDGQAAWSDREGRWQQGRLGRNHFVSPALLVLELELAGNGRERMVLMGDSTSPEGFRRLRVWLRWRAPASRKRE